MTTMTFSTHSTMGTDDCIFSLASDGSLGVVAQKLNDDCGGLVQKAVSKARLAPSSVVTVTDSNCRHLVGLVASKPDDKDTESSLTEALMFGGKAYETAHQLGMEKFVCVFEPKDKVCSGSEASWVAMGASLKAHRFDRYRSQLKDDEKPCVKQLEIVCDDDKNASVLWKQEEHLVEGVCLARDLVFEPANVLTPKQFAQQCDELKKLGVTVEIFDKKKLTQLKMGALLGVAQGSANEPYVAIMQWNGGAQEKPLAFIGKGVTFDTGGISIKPSSGMEEMKMDMAGAAAVTGLMRCLAGRKAKVNAIGMVGLVENMPSSTAQRPGDIVHSYSQQTIEVLNTDAEGRLVLADLLSYCNEKFEPQLMINLATLTGAIIVALGNDHAGLFSNDDQLAQRLQDAATRTGEDLWRLPLGKNFDKMLDSTIADMQNITNKRGAGSITAAQFLHRFVGKTPWAHLDIAGVAWSDKPTSISAKGGSGYGVRLLDEFVRQNYEG